MAKNKIDFKGKLGGKHTTVIDGARIFINEIAKEKTITRISPGFITQGKKSSARPRLKITEEKGGILLTFRVNCGIQEIRILTSEINLTKTTIHKVADEQGFGVSYLNRTQASA
jgi:hypothetical protein